MNENKTYKEYKNKLDISPIMQKGDSTNAVVYSFDLDTSKFTYELKMNGQPLSLANASEVNIVLYFGGDDPEKYPKANLVGVIEDKLNGKVSFTMPKQYLGFSGQVLGEIDITFKNGQSLTAGHFSFIMKSSYIDEGLEIEQQVYVERFEDLEGLLKETSEAIKNNDIVRKPELAAVENKKADKTALNDVSIELLNKADKKTVNEINRILPEKADKSEVESLKSGVGGAVSNFNELLAKFPNGDSKFWVTTDDGHYYSWQDNYWQDIGVFQNAVIGESSIDLWQTRFGEIVSKNLFDKRRATKGVLGSFGQIVKNDDFFTSYYIQVKPNQKYKLNVNIQNYAEYSNENKLVNFVEKYGKGEILTSGETSYIRFSFYHTNLDKAMCCLNNVPVEFEAYKEQILSEVVPEKPIKNDNIKNGEISSIKLEDYITGPNKANPEYIKTGVFVNPDNGNTMANSSYDTIYLMPNPFERDTDVVVTSVRSFACYDANKNNISGKGLTFTSNPVNQVIHVTTDMKYISVTYSSKYKDKFQIIEGTKMIDYTPFGYKLKGLVIDEANVIHSKEEKENEDFMLNLPGKLYVVPGMTLELYHSQICWTGNIENYHFKFDGKIGQAFKRKWSLTATESMLGTHTITCIVYDNSLNEVTRQQMTVVVGKYNFTKPKNVLTIGDSLSNTTSSDKPWYAKVRQLSANLINFVGTRGLKTGEMHEGRSGWTAQMYLTGVTYDFEKEGSSPFWNPTSQKFDYQYYITKTGIDADAVQIFLGTNGMSLDPTNTANAIKQMVENIQSVRPNIPVFVVNTIYRSNQDGIAKQASNDGYNASSGVMKLEEDRKVFNLIQRLNELFEDNKNVVLVPLAHCHDSEYNYGNEPTKVNPRNDLTVKTPKESIHPQYEGYMQFADVFFCMYCALNEF